MGIAITDSVADAVAAEQAGLDGAVRDTAETGIVTLGSLNGVNQVFLLGFGGIFDAQIAGHISQSFFGKLWSCHGLFHL